MQFTITIEVMGGVHDACTLANEIAARLEDVTEMRCWSFEETFSAEVADRLNDQYTDDFENNEGEANPQDAV